MLRRMMLALALVMWVAAPVVRAADAAHETAAAAHDAANSAAAAPHGAGEALESDAHGEGHGHKQPPLLPDPTDRTVQIQAVWVVIIFLVLLVILYKTAWKQILAGLKNREQKIRQDIADAEAARKKAEATLGEYNQRLATAEQQVRDLLARAQTDAEKIAANVRMQAQKESEEIKDRTTRDIDAARKQAMAEFREYAATVATSAAEQILRRNLNAEDQRDLVNRSLDQLQSVES